MGDLEDDVLMAYIAQGKRMALLRERMAQMDRVWMDLDRLVKAILREPVIGRALESELMALRSSVEAVLTYDEIHRESPDASDSGDAALG